MTSLQVEETLSLMILWAPPDHSIQETVLDWIVVE
jgi:hypothetical protein